eukprot:1195718-Prorocentrum_minimum.AAC.3
MTKSEHNEGGSDDEGWVSGDDSVSFDSDDDWEDPSGGALGESAFVTTLWLFSRYIPSREQCNSPKAAFACRGVVNTLPCVHSRPAYSAHSPVRPPALLHLVTHSSLVA